MTFTQIGNALGLRLSTMAAVPPIAWPNADAPGVVPYLAVAHFPNTRTNPVLSGGGHSTLSGIFLITVVTARGAFTGPANAIAQAVADRFPKALHLTAGSGSVVITDPAEPVPGFTDGVHWRQPVRVRYRSEP